MRNFTEILLESSKKINEEPLEIELIDKYANTISKNTPKEVGQMIYLTKKLNILTLDEMNLVKGSTKSGLKTLSNKYGWNIDDLTSLYTLMTKKSEYISILPQFMSKNEIEMIIKGDRDIEDAMLDLTSEKGRSEVVKMYKGVVISIVNKYKGKSKLSWDDLYSVGLEAMVEAMNTYKTNSGPHTSFKTFLAYRVQQRILSAMTYEGHTLKYTNRAYANGYRNDAVSYDAMLSKDSDDKNGKSFSDMMADLGGADEIGKDNEETLKRIYNALEKKFKMRDCEWFYHILGLNGYEKMSGAEVGRKYGADLHTVSAAFRKIIKYIQSNDTLRNYLTDLYEAYQCNLFSMFWGKDYEYISEALANDDVFILLEDATKWSNKSFFQKSLDNAMSKFKKNEKDYINNVLNNDFEYLDSSFKKHKDIIIDFLSGMYPTEVMNQKSDVSLLEYMMNIKEIYSR